MNPFFNKHENRPRASLRIIFYVFVSIIILSIGNSVPLFGLEYILTTLLLYAVFWVFFRFVDNRESIRQAGLNVSENWWKEFSFGCLIGFIAMIFVFCLEWIMGDLKIIGFGWESVGNQFWFWPVLLFLVQMLGVGFYEELITRSYLLINIKEGLTFSKLTPKKATILAVILSSIIFGLGHIGNPNVTIFALLNILCAGIMLAIPFIITGRLSYSIGLHFSWNFFQGGVFGFRVSGLPIRNSIIEIQQSGNPMWTGGSFGPEGGLIGLLGILIISLIFLFYFKSSMGFLNLNNNFTKTYIENEQTSTKMDELT